MNDPLSGTPWSEAATVCGFAQSPPNQTLMDVCCRPACRRCGAAARHRLRRRPQRHSARASGLDSCRRSTCRSACCGRHSSGSQPKPPGAGSAWRWRRWNSCRSPDAAWTSSSRTGSGTWRRRPPSFAPRCVEAARVARPGVRSSSSPSRVRRCPIPIGRSRERYVYTRFSGGPQIFLTVDELVEELAAAGFSVDPSIPIVEHNRRCQGAIYVGGAPVFIEGAFSYSGKGDVDGAEIRTKVACFQSQPLPKICGGEC